MTTVPFMLASAAAAAERAVPELLTRATRELEVARRTWEIRRERRTAWVTLAARVTAQGSWWQVLR